MAKLAKIKTTQNAGNVDDYLNAIVDENRRKDCKTIAAMMKKHSGEEPRMWGTAMIGFGKKIYKSPNTGREVEWFLIGFSPRKANISLHLVMDIKKMETLLQKLGKHKSGVGCLYINSLKDVDIMVLEEMVVLALER